MIISLRYSRFRSTASSTRDCSAFGTPIRPSFRDPTPNRHEASGDFSSCVTNSSMSM